MRLIRGRLALFVGIALGVLAQNSDHGLGAWAEFGIVVGGSLAAAAILALAAWLWSLLCDAVWKPIVITMGCMNPQPELPGPQFVVVEVAVLNNRRETLTNALLNGLLFPPGESVASCDMNGFPFPTGRGKPHPQGQVSVMNSSLSGHRTTTDFFFRVALPEEASCVLLFTLSAPELRKVMTSQIALRRTAIGIEEVPTP